MAECTCCIKINPAIRTLAGFITLQSESMQVELTDKATWRTFTHEDVKKGVELRISGPGSVTEAL